MILQRFFNEQLAQASFLVACSQTKQAIVIDPTLQIGQYLDFAGARRLCITMVTETHIHADYLSGSLALATACGAMLLLSGETQAGDHYSVPASVAYRLLHDGDVFAVGSLEFQAIHTPGHTPEHLTFAVTDHHKRSEPICLFTGDFLFTGEVGRPDLAERSAGRLGTIQSAAASLFGSLKKAKEWQDDQIIWPGHGAGSACGKSLEAAPATSVGLERSSNWAFQAHSECEFVQEVLNGQPEPPAYFGRMKRWNRTPVVVPLDLDMPTEIKSFDELELILRDGTVPVDLRETSRFVRSHLEAAIHLPAGFATVMWGGSVLEPKSALLLIADLQETASYYAQQFALIGIGPVVGWLPARTIEEASWLSHQLVSLAEIAPDEPGLDKFHMVDVRDPVEYQRGHFERAMNWPLTSLQERLTAAEKLPILFQCQSGVRSAIAASVFRRMGWRNVASMKGGIARYANRAAA